MKKFATLTALILLALASTAQTQVQTAGLVLGTTGVVASSVLSVSDNFNGSNESPLVTCPGSPRSGTCWATATGDNSVEILTNQIMGITTSRNAEHWVGNDFSGYPNQCAQVTVKTVSTWGTGVVVRANAASNSYYLFTGQATPGYYELGKVTAGVYAAIGASYAITPAANDVVKLCVTGSSTTVLTPYINGSAQATRSDSSSPFTTGSPGVYIYDEYVMDDFSAWSQ